MTRLSRAEFTAAMNLYAPADRQMPVPEPRKPNPNRIPERVILAEIILYLRKHPLVIRKSIARMNVVGGGGDRVRTGIPGMCDIWATLTDRRALWIEVKAPDGKVSEAQREFLEMVRGPHQVAFVAWSVADVKAWLG